MSFVFEFGLFNLSLGGIMFIEGNLYHRGNDLHKKYKGNPQSGISPCSEHPIVFLFTSPIGSIHGYKDHWIDSEHFQYSGEGQIGDMTFTRGNKAIKEHSLKNRGLYLFEKQKSGLYKYLGKFVYVNHSIEIGKDELNQDREVILFKLKKILEK